MSQQLSLSDQPPLSGWELKSIYSTYLRTVVIEIVVEFIELHYDFHEN